ncbi:hypothetical protein GW17_00043779 [Ensete ventricosum]|nr:hypothetical protein GW17_00043779 [Ensete ventricosum]
MALKLWASSAANALRISCSGARTPFPAFSISRCFSSGIKELLLPQFCYLSVLLAVIDGLKYTSSHEWVKHEGSVATIGITDHAQRKREFVYGVLMVVFIGQGHLGEVVFVELPESGVAVAKGGSFGAVESVKATSDVNSPVSGEVIEVNPKLTETPGLINSSPYEDGWMIKVKPSDPSELNSLMGSKEYTKLCEEEDAH